jgi:dTDP-4-amino-4,6-dideoxygalactose transaminase
MKIKNFFFHLRYFFDLRNIRASLLVFFYSILKKNTKYPNYLLNFEKEICKFFESSYAITFSNGTTACVALLYSLGVKKNSKVLISKLSFPSVISSVLRVGAIPVYLNFDKNLQLDANVGNKTILESDYIIITHVYGIPQNYAKINEILKVNPKLILIEDISHSQGAISDNKIVGTLGKGSFMSMQGDKAISAGEGGLVITNLESVANKIMYLSHLNRKISKSNNFLNSLSKIGFIGKGRMHPLGAITALSDLKNLQNRNKFVREKLKLIYESFKDFKHLSVPHIDNYENIGGFHFGIPFFCSSEKLLNILSSFFKIIKYDWPILDSNQNFCDPDKFLNLIYSDKPNISGVFEKSNDLRDELYFFDLKEVIKIKNNKIYDNILKIKKIFNENRF